MQFCDFAREGEKNKKLCKKVAKKFAKYNLFIVYLHRRSKMDCACKRDVRDGREMVAMKQRIQSVTTQRKEKYDSRSNYTHRNAERTA